MGNIILKMDSHRADGGAKAKTLLAFVVSYAYRRKANWLNWSKSIHKNHNNPSNKETHLLLAKSTTPT